MKINSLTINGIGGIKHLDLKFNDKLNVICGANGIGKSTILNIISDAFNAGFDSKLKRNALYTIGKYNLKISDIVDNKCQQKEVNIKVTNFQPEESVYTGKWGEDAKKFLFFNVERNINYITLNSISRDPKRDNYIISTIAKSGVQADDIKNWFVNRYMFMDKNDSLKPEQIQNFNLAQKSFSILDNTINFKTVIANTFDIILSTPNGDIYFEYLSSGYKSCIYIILGIIKEIEYRYNESPINVNNFDGIIAIDEIDLHLHPTWQAGLVEALKTIFPRVQFILTTHSPSILQILEKDEIIALGHDDNNDIYVKNLKLGKYGLQGWTLEEILQYVMEMPSTSSQLYLNTIKNFDKAMNDENKDEILKQYNLLKEMLHPNNPLLSLLSIQVAEWED